MTNETRNYKNLSISQLAACVRKDWKSVSPCAQPYLSAMFSIEKLEESYGYDTAKDIVARFLVNAAAWRGEVARAIKKELNRRLSTTKKGHTENE